MSQIVTPNQVLALTGGTINVPTFTGTLNNGADLGTGVAAFEWTQPFSVAISFRPTTNTPDRVIIARMRQVAPYKGWSVIYTTAGYIRVELIANYSSQYFSITTTTTPIAVNSWADVVVGYDGSNTAAGIRVFVNGVPQSQTVTTNNPMSSTMIDATTKLFVGNRQDIGNYGLVGNCKITRIFNRVLADDEIPNILKRRLPSDYPGLLLNLQDRFTGTTTWHDDGPNGYNATLSSVTLTQFAEDLTGRNHATISGATPIVPKIRHGMQFDGVDDFILLPTGVGQFERTQPFTVSFWIRAVGGTFGGQYKEIIGNMLNGGTNRGWIISTDGSFNSSGNGSRLYFALYNTVNSNALQVLIRTDTMSPSINLLDNNWHHFVCTYDGLSSSSSMVVYCDGRLCNLTVEVSNLNATTLSGIQATIGKGSSARTACVTGCLDEVKIWSRALTAQQASDEYQTNTHNDTSGRVLYYSFDENTESLGITGTPTGSLRSNITNYLGCKFTVTKNLRVNALGRWMIAGNTGTRLLTIYNNTDSVIAAQATLDLTGQTANEYAYVSIPTVTLVPGKTYSISTYETIGQEWRDQAGMTTHPSVVISTAAWNGVQCASTGNAGQCYVGLTFKIVPETNWPYGVTVNDGWGRNVVTQTPGVQIVAGNTSQGNAAQFSSGSTSLNYAITPAFGINEGCSVTFDIYAGAITADTVIFEHRPTQSGSMDFGVHRRSSDGGLSVWFYTTSWQGVLGPVITSNAWNRIALVRRAATKTIDFYVNGVKTTPAAYTGTYAPINNYPWVLGKSANMTFRIDNLALMNYELSDAEEAAIRASGTYPASGRLALWQFNETDGPVWADDWSHRTLVANGPTRVLPHGQRPFIRLDGTDDYLSIANNADFTLTTSTSFTVSAWVRYRGRLSSSVTGEWIIARQSGGWPGWRMQASTASVLRAVIGATVGAGTQTDIASKAAWQDGRWHHVVMVVDRTLVNHTLLTYFDGVLANSVTFTNSWDIEHATAIEIGRWSSSPAASALGGDVCDVRYYKNKPLNASDIRRLFITTHPLNG